MGDLFESMFDKVAGLDVVKASEVARTRQVVPLTITVTDKRITNTFSVKSLYLYLGEEHPQYPYYRS